MPVAHRSLSAASRLVRYACWAGAGLVAAFALVAAAGPAPPHALTSIARAQLLAVSALSATGAWAVGDLDTGGPAGLHTLAVHWNGTAWTQVPVPSPGNGVSGSTLSGVSAVSASDAWAVGCYGFNVNTGASTTLALHWDSTRWAQVATPSPGAAHSVCLEGVTALSASDGGPSDSSPPALPRARRSPWCCTGTAPAGLRYQARRPVTPSSRS